MHKGASYVIIISVVVMDAFGVSSSSRLRHKERTIRCCSLRSAATPTGGLMFAKKVALNVRFLGSNASVPGESGVFCVRW